MSDSEDVRARMATAWRDAAARAYEAAHGVLEEQPERDAPRWRWRWNPRVAVTAVLVVALGVTLVTWWQAPHGAAGAAMSAEVEAPSAQGAGIADRDAGAASPTGGPGAAATVTVHIAGNVASPGVYVLPQGARVADAVEAAGGATVPADLDSLNLARVVSDGERIGVGEGAEGAAGASADVGGKVNVNTASAARLEDLPGVGPVLAGRIVAYRDEHGPFASVDALDAVTGVGPAVLAGLRDAATV